MVEGRGGREWVVVASVCVSSFCGSVCRYHVLLPRKGVNVSCSEGRIWAIGDDRDDEGEGDGDGGNDDDDDDDYDDDNDDYLAVRIEMSSC